MHDAFGRRINYVRLSVTDRCNLRCTYCMAEDMQFMPRRDLLTFDEIERLALHLVGHCASPAANLSSARASSISSPASRICASTGWTKSH